MIRPMACHASRILCVWVCVLSLFSPPASSSCLENSVSAQETQVLGAYIAYYGRIADPGGLDWWSAQLAQAGSLDLIIDAFGVSAEFDERFGALDAESLITNLYQQILGREPEPAGLTYWQDEYESGRQTLQAIALSIWYGVQNDDLVTTQNKLRVSEHYLAELARRNALSLQLTADTLSTILSSVTAQSTSVAAACNQLTDVVDTALNQNQEGSTIEFGMEVDIEAVASDLTGWFATTKARGINWISFEPFTLDGDVFFSSPTLMNAGFTLSAEYGDVLGEILAEAKKQDIKVAVMLEAFAHIREGSKAFDPKLNPDALTPSALESLIQELGTLARAADYSGLGVTEEAFTGDWLTTIANEAKNQGLEYTHFFDDTECRPDLQLSEDYAYYPKNARQDGDDQAYLRNINALASYLGQLGYLDLMYGTAAACGSKRGVATAGGWGFGPATHQNIAVYRGIQYGPERYVFILAEDENGTIFSEEEAFLQSYDFAQQLKPLLDMHAKKTSDSAKPIANIVLEYPDSQKYPDAADVYGIAVLSSSFLSSALLAAGYDLRVTHTPLATADLYYVLTAGDLVGQGTDLSDASAALLNKDTPVYFQIVGAAKDTTNFQSLFQRLGLSAIPTAVGNVEEQGTRDPTPQTVEVVLSGNAVELPYAGVSIEVWFPELAGQFAYGHYVHQASPASFQAEMLLQGRMSAENDGVYDDDTALLVRNGNVHWVNGGFIHHGMVAAFANVFSGTSIYASASYGYLTTGQERSAFWAPYDTALDLQLPAGSQVTQFDEKGNRLSTPTVQLEQGRLSGTVARFHLVVVD